MSDKTKLAMKKRADEIRAEIASLDDNDLVLFAEVARGDDFGTVKSYIQKAVEKHLMNMPF